MATFDDVFAALLSIMSVYGPDVDFRKPKGEEGAYYVLSDDHGDRSQRVAVLSKQISTDDLVENIQLQLLKHFSDWKVYVEFEDGTDRGSILIQRASVEPVSDSQPHAQPSR